MPAEFGQRRPAQHDEPENESGGLMARLSEQTVDPMQLLQGAGYCLLGYLVASIAIGTLAPPPGPEFMRFVYVPREARKDLIQDSFEIAGQKDRARRRGRQMSTALSNNAKFACVAGGMVLSLIVALYVRIAEPPPQFAEVPESYPFFDPAKEKGWREHEQVAIMNWLGSGPDALCADNRRHARSAVLSYFRQRARSIVIAQHFLPADAALRYQQLWDGETGRKVEAAVVDAARKGLIYRSDFQPILPELAALIDRAQPVTPVCP